MRRLLLPVPLVLAASSLSAQVAKSVRDAAETITAKQIAHHVQVLADDSMMGRGTPSRGLELTARYVAGHFQKLGLKAAGDSGTWLQYFPLRNDTMTAPNTVGILEGSDFALKHEYIVIVAHMDHIGFSRGRSQGDSIYNGAADNASGTAGVIELARAFTQPGARPRRSLIFLTVGGEEGGLRGSKYFVEHPPVPLPQLVASINLDMIGSPRDKDSVSVHGGLDSYLGGIVSRVAAANPELRLTVNLEEGLSGGSDHTSFRQKGVPILFFHTAARSYAHYHRPTDSAEKIDADLEARLLRLIFHVTREAANANERPR